MLCAAAVETLQQTLGNAVAIACGGYESVAIGDAHHAAPVIQKPVALHFTGDKSDRGTARSE